MPLRIGTRGSRLALVQTERVCRLLSEKGIEVETSIIRTRGDEVTEIPLHEIGAQGVFVRALDDAILRDEIDAAVHSMKDIPTKRPAGVLTAAVLPRDAPNDFLVHECPLEDVQIVGTSSMRRRAQLLRHDPHLTIKPLRGNVDTRLQKCAIGEYDAIVLAQAGIGRLNLQVPGTRLPVSRFVPSPNQGVIAIVCRNESAIVDQVAPFNDPVTEKDALWERAVMEEVGGGCFIPMGCYSLDGKMSAEILALDGSRTVRIEGSVATAPGAREFGARLQGQAKSLIEDARRRLGVQDEEG
jgi:hydroxymethylbilane synthase